MVERVQSTTVAVMPTSIFGLSFEAKALCEAIRQRNPKALILLDCCQAFDARWHGERLTSQGDAALLAFGLGKPMTTLYGGALLTNRDDLAQAVRQYRHTTFRTPGRAAALRRWSYFLGSWLALSSPCVRLTDWLEHVDTPLQRYLLTLRAREAIRLPADYNVLMLPLEAAIGRAQLQRAASFMHRRREIAAIYAQALGNVSGLELLPWTDGASYAIYAVRLQQPAQRQHVLKSMRQSGVQGDTVLSYVIPGLACYRAQGYTGTPFPQAVAWSQSILNLPNHPTMSDKQVWCVVHAVREALGESCD